LFSLSGLLPAQNEPTYHLPSAAIAAVVDAPLTPSLSLSPDRKTLLLLERSALPPVAELAQPELRLAGLRIDPATNSPSRETYSTGVVIKQLDTNAESRLAGLPAEGRIGEMRWSADSRHLAFTVSSEKAVELWIADVAAGQA